MRFDICGGSISVGVVGINSDSGRVIAVTNPHGETDDMEPLECSMIVAKPGDAAAEETRIMVRFRARSARDVALLHQ